MLSPRLNKVRQARSNIKSMLVMHYEGIHNQELFCQAKRLTSTTARMFCNVWRSKSAEMSKIMMEAGPVGSPQQWAGAKSYVSATTVGCKNVEEAPSLLTSLIWSIEIPSCF
jgi:hypothetical protein